MTFLPSVNANYMPVPSSYYGVGTDGEIKVRGIEIRQRNAPRIVKSLQKEIIENMGKVAGKNDLRKLLNDSVRILRNHIKMLDNATAQDLSMRVRFGRDEYKVNCPQRVLKNYLKRKGVSVMAGQTISYVIENFEKQVYVPTEDYREIFDRKKYIALLKKAFIRLFLPFDIDEKDLDGTYQKKLFEFDAVTEVNIVEDKVCLYPAFESSQKGAMATN
jgi:DNA polymerase elongation subunit (family B)